LPPRLNGKLCFSHAWDQQACRPGPVQNRSFRLEGFPAEPISAIDNRENACVVDDPSWSYCDYWLAAFARFLIQENLIAAVAAAWLEPFDACANSA
jgi:hypothetical protein